MTATNVRVQMQQRKDTAANWASANPTLLSGELGYETDTGKWKVGTGSAAWSALGYTIWSQISAYPLATADIADDAVTGAKLANNIDIAGTLDVTSAATFDNNVTVQGDLTVNGTTTTIDTTTLVVEDKNIEIGKVSTPTDTTADGGGITLKGATDKTINWVDATDAWTFSEHLNIVSGKEYRIAGTKVLDATSLGSAVVSSSLTSVGTIGTGVWNGTAIASAYIADSAITSAKIADGTIINADVNASAAIAGTKISPDFGSQAVTTTGLISADGKVSFPLGTAALPSLYPGSDTNTGIYSPGADQLAISTNGTGRLFVDAAGRVGIGSVSASDLFEVSKASDGSVGPVLSLRNSTDLGGTNSGAEIRFNFRDTASNRHCVIGAANASSNSRSGYIYFKTNSGTNAPVERLRIDSSGRVGIGTSAPERALVVSDAGAEGFEFYPGSSDTGNTLNHYDRASASFIDITTTADKHIFSRADGEKMRIDSSGNVGIGTSSPITRLHVNSGTTDLAGILESSDANVFLAFKDGSTSGNQQVQIGAVTNNLVAYAGGSERLRIDSSGRVGIGTSSPAGGLHVDAASGVDGPVFDSGGTGNTNHALLVRDSGNNQLFRVNNNGNVGIGTTSPSTKLHVAESVGAAVLTLQSQDSVQASVVFGDTSDESRGRIDRKSVV